MMPRAIRSLSSSASCAAVISVMSRPMKKCRRTGSDQVPIQASDDDPAVLWT